MVSTRPKRLGSAAAALLGFVFFLTRELQKMKYISVEKWASTISAITTEEIESWTMWLIFWIGVTT
jgi:hypothetical protein